MKLSEAIRLGAMLKPQGHSHLLYDGSTCALGAALDAVGQLGSHEEEDAYRKVYAQWPILQQEVFDPRVGGRRALYLGIWRRNDSDGWTREQIADWVETIERALEPVIATEDRSSLEPAVELGALAQK